MQNRETLIDPEQGVLFQPDVQPEMCSFCGYFQVLGSPKQPCKLLEVLDVPTLSRQRSRVRVSSSPPFTFKYTEKNRTLCRKRKGCGTRRSLPYGNLRSFITIFLMPLSKVMCVLLVVGAAIPSAARTKMPPVLAACSAFAPDGTSAMATITGDTLELTVAVLSGQNSKLTLPLKHRAQQSQLDNPADRWRVYNCSLFFNSTSGLVAVGITTESEPPQRLQVAVADFRTAKWLSDFDVEPRKELGSRTNLAGFLRDTDSVVVIRNWNSSVSESIAVLLFSAAWRASPDPASSSGVVGRPLALLCRRPQQSALGIPLHSNFGTRLSAAILPNR